MPAIFRYIICVFGASANTASLVTSSALVSPQEVPATAARACGPECDTARYCSIPQGPFSYQLESGGIWASSQLGDARPAGQSAQAGGVLTSQPNAFFDQESKMVMFSGRVRDMSPKLAVTGCEKGRWTARNKDLLS